MATHTNIIANGDFWGASIDFNASKGVAPGDTVILKGNYGHIEFGKINGVTFLNDGPVTIKSMNIYAGGRDIKLLGNGTAGLERGIKIQGTNFGINWEAVGSLEIGYVEIIGNAMGIKVSTQPNVSYPLDYQSLYIHHCKIQGVGQEGMYLGRDELGGPFITGKVIQNSVSDCGRDGIQVRNGVFEVNYNSVTNVGLNGEGIHDEAILFGGNSKGGICKGNIIQMVPGNGIFCNGAGEFFFVQNTMNVKGPGIFTKSPIVAEDLQKLGYQHITIQGNTITSASGIALQSYKENAVPTTIKYYQNATTGRTEVMPGITFTTDVPVPNPPPAPIALHVSMQQVPVTVTLPHIVIKSDAGLPYEVYSVSSTPRFLFGGVTTSGETKIDVSKVTNKYFTVIIKGVSYKVNK